MRKNKAKLALGFTALSYIWVMLTVVLAASAYPDYSHVSQFMSELGATGAPHADMVNLGGFLIGALLLLAALAMVFVTVQRNLSNMIALVIFAQYPLLIIVASFFPCDTACRTQTPSTSHMIHMTSAFAAYLAAIIGLTFLSLHAHKWLGPSLLRPLAMLLPIVLFLMLFSLTPGNAYVGLLQRLFETLIYGWLIYYLLMIERGHSPR